MNATVCRILLKYTFSILLQNMLPPVCRCKSILLSILDLQWLLIFSNAYFDVFFEPQFNHYAQLNTLDPGKALGFAFRTGPGAPGTKMGNYEECSKLKHLL